MSILGYDPSNKINNDSSHCLFKSIECFMIDVDKSIPLIVSLSGGPDSMVLTIILKSLGYTIIAGHINYGNRDETKEEEDFVREECKKCEIPFESRIIDEAKRGEIARNKYEKLTADIRFEFYHNLLKKHKAQAVIYGHHRGDMFENVLTNFMIRARSVFDLVVIEPRKIKNGVMIWRPMIDHYKKDIYDYAHLCNIPYLKDTTPEWSARWKVRNIVKPALLDMGMSVENVLQNAISSETYGSIIHSEIVKPILDNPGIKVYNKCFFMKLDLVSKCNKYEIFMLVLKELFHSIGISQLSFKNTQILYDLLLTKTTETVRISIKKDIRCLFFSNYLFVSRLDWKPTITTETVTDDTDENRIALDDLLQDKWCFYCRSPEVVNKFSKKKHSGICIIPDMLSIIYTKSTDGDIIKTGIVL